MKQKLLLALLALFTLGGSNLFAQTWTGNKVAEGDFYLYNVGQRKWLTSGNSWGTQGSLTTTGGFDCSLELSNGKYAINTKMRTNNKENGPGYLGNNGYVDGENPTYFEFIQASRTDGIIAYFIKDGENSFKYSGSGNTCDFGTETGDNAQWILVSKQNRIDALAKATEDSPIDATFYIEGANFGRYDVNRNGKWQGSPAQGGLNTNMCAEKFCGSAGVTFNVYQSFAAPNGRYKLMVQGFDRWNDGTTYNALPAQTARENGTETINAYIYINDTKQDLKSILDNIMTTTGDGSYTEVTGGSVPQDMNAASYAFNQGLYENELTVEVSSKQITVGVKCDGSVAREWTIFDNFRLYYLGPLDLSVFETALADAVAAAEATEGTVPSAAYNAIAAVVSEYNKTYDNEEGYSTAIQAINNAVATYASDAIVADYTRYKNIRTAVLAINSGIDVSAANTQVEEATTTAGIDAAILTLRNALTAYLPNAQLGDGETIDLTNALIDNADPGINETLDYWTNSETPSLQYNLYEYYQKSGATTKQTIASTLPAGNYKLTAVAFTRSSYEAKLNAGENSTNIATVGSDVVNNREQGNTWIANGNGVTNLVFNLAEPTANLEIGLTAATQGDHWMCWRSFRLVYGDVFEPYTLVEGKMNADVAAEQTAAESAYKNNPSPATYQALMDAIAAAQASAKAYEDMTAAITKIDAALEAATSATASAEAYNTIKSAYNEGSIADADIMTKVAEAYNAVIPVIKSQTAAQADFTLAIQNQSFEYGNMTGWTAASSSDTGVRETSNATYATTGSDGKYLFNTWWQGVPITQAITNLPNGEYTLTVSVASDGATIYLLANGEHNEGIETYETTDAEQGQYSKDTFQEATFTFLVKDGNATIGVVGGANGTAGEHKDYVEAGYWWYKADNFRLVKNRELTEEEQAVTPTGITLDKTEVTLTATDNSVTLTPTFDPENATTTVTWTTSDANIATVADGVVTGVAPGTATITVASTLNADVKATCTVTVSYPETEVASDDYVNEGAKRTVVSYGDNLIKNGAFEYPNSFYGWTTGSGVAMSADNFELITEENNHYIKAKGHTGAGDVNSIGTGWAIEAGKTYVFGYQVKSTSAGNSEFHVVSLTNELGKEASKISENSTAVGTDWTNVKYKFTNTDGYAYVQFRARWLNSAVSFDNFYLVEVVDEEVIGNVQYALDAIPTANIGENAFQYSQETIDAANTLVQGEASVADVEAAYEALTTLNAPTADQVFNIIMGELTWTNNNNAVMLSTKGKAITFYAGGRNDAGGYTSQFDKEPNTNLAQGFYFTAAEGKNKYTIYQIDAAGAKRYLCTGVVYGGNANQVRTTTEADKAEVYTVTATNTEGVYNFTNASNINLGAQDAGLYGTTRNNNLLIVETQKPSITINTTAAGWGTTILPFAVSEIPEGVKVYSCLEDKGATLELTEVNALEANKPYIIEGAWNATLTGDAQGTALSYEDGQLIGTYVKIAAPNACYVLQKQGDKVGFFKVDTSVAQPNVPANRAYMKASTSGAKAFYLGEDTNGINAIEALISGNAEIFNINGVKQNSLQKGINIIKTEDGKTHKIMVK